MNIASWLWGLCLTSETWKIVPIIQSVFCEMLYETRNLLDVQIPGDHDKPLEVCIDRLYTVKQIFPQALMNPVRKRELDIE